MNKHLLNDSNEFPDDKILLKHLDKSKVLWDELTSTVSSNFPPTTLEWKYYKDGGSWLGKLVQKKKTVCWISVWDKFFKVSFYFTEKNDKDIKNMKIDQSLKDAYFAHKPIGKLKPLTVEVKTKKALKDVCELISYKTSL
ncbi:DUF3788 family protein [bacterium]|nr:MAG: DUF3788 family protein [bacterium]